MEGLSSTEGIDSLDEGIEFSISTFSSAELGLEDGSTNCPWPRKNPVIPGPSGSVPKYEHKCHHQEYPYSSEHRVHVPVFPIELNEVRRSKDMS